MRARALFDWLIHERGVPDPRRTLHNRTYAGDTLMRRLLAVETKII